MAFRLVYLADMRVRLLTIAFAVCSLWKANAQGYLQPIATVSTNTDLRALYEKFQLPIVIIGTVAYIPSEDCQCHESRKIAGDTDQRQVGGDTDNRQIGGDIDYRQIGGDIDNRQVAGNIDQRQTGGGTDNRQVTGNTDNRQVVGNTDQRQTAGDTDKRQVAGNKDERQTGGDTDSRQVAGNGDQRQFGGDIAQIPCIKLDDCSGFKILSANKLAISVFNGSTNEPLSGTVVLFNDQK